MHANKYIRVMGSSNSMNSQLKGQLSFLNKYYEVIAVAPGGKYLQSIKEREKVKTIDLSMERGISPFKDFKSLIKLIRILKQERPYIVHGSSPKGALLSMLASWFCRVPHRIYTVTGLRFETTKGWLRKLLISIEKINCFCATKVIPEGNGVKKVLIDENITKKKLNVIFNGNINGINTDYYSIESVAEPKKNIRKVLNISDDTCCFIFIGRLVRDKGVNELIQAFAALSRSYDIELLLLGDVEDVNPIDFSSMLEIEENPRIQYFGYKEDIRYYLKAADIFVLPSYREGFPNVVLQAGAMSLPSIVTDISGCNEIVSDGDSGRLILPNSFESLKRAMEEMIIMRQENPGYLSQMGKSAHINVSNKFAQADVWKALLEELNNL